MKQPPLETTWDRAVSRCLDEGLVTVRRLAKLTGLSKAQVRRVWHNPNVQKRVRSIISERVGTQARADAVVLQ